MDFRNIIAYKGLDSNLLKLSNFIGGKDGTTGVFLLRFKLLELQIYPYFVDHFLNVADTVAPV